MSLRTLTVPLALAASLLVAVPTTAHADTQPDIVLRSAKIRVDDAHFQKDKEGCLSSIGKVGLLRVVGKHDLLLAVAPIGGDLEKSTSGVVHLDLGSGIAAQVLSLCPDKAHRKASLGTFTYGPTSVWLGSDDKDTDDPTYVDDSTATLTIKQSSRFDAIVSRREGRTAHIAARLDVYSISRLRWAAGLNKPVDLYRKEHGEWVRVASTSSGRIGVVRFAVKAGGVHSYRVAYAGSDVTWGRTSVTFRA